MPWFTNDHEDRDRTWYEVNDDSMFTPTDEVVNELNEIRTEIEQSTPAFNGSSLSVRDEIAWVSRLNFTPKTCIKAGERAKDMPTTTTPQRWLMEEALDTLNHLAVGDAYAGETYDDKEGMEGVGWLLCREASNRLQEHAQSPMTSRAEAFNTVADEWPYEARLLLAKYEYVEHADDLDDDYLHDVQRVNDNYDFTETMGTDWQTKLDWYFEANPFRDNDLTDQEANTVMLVASEGEMMTPEQLDEISNHSRFRSRFRETGGIASAIDLDSFDETVPSHVVGSFASPSEWDELDPGNVESAGCPMCGSTLHHGVVENEGETWVTENGGYPVGGSQLNTPSADFYTLDSTDFGVLCGDCEQQYETANKPLVSYLPDGERTALSFHTYQGVWKSLTDASLRDVPDEARERLNTLYRRSELRDDDYHSISPSAMLGDVTPQQEAIRQLTLPETTIEEGPAFVFVATDNPQPASVHVPKTDMDTVTAVKNALEEAVEHAVPA